MNRSNLMLEGHSKSTLFLFYELWTHFKIRAQLQQGKIDFNKN